MRSVGVFGTIVIGYDGTDRSAGALGLGSAIARVTGDEVAVVLAYPVKPLSARVGGGELQDVSRPEALRRLDSARARLEGVRLRHLRSTPAASPVEALRTAAVDDDARLIVVAASTGARRGVGERLLPRAPCAVAVARPWTGGHPRLSRVAVAVGGSAPAGQALRYASALRSLPGGPVEEFDVLSYGEGEAPAWVRDAAAGCHGRLVRENRPATEALLSRSRSLDLLVVETRGRGLLRGLALGRVARDVVRSAECPVLVVPRSAPAPGGGA